MNTNGGGLSYTHPGQYGMFLLVEAVRQLRGECGPRQVAGAEIAVAHGSGGVLSTMGTLVLGTEATRVTPCSNRPGLATRPLAVLGRDPRGELVLPWCRDVRARVLVPARRRARTASATTSSGDAPAATGVVYAASVQHQPGSGPQQGRWRRTSSR